MLLQNILSSSGSFRLVAKLQQKSEIFSFSQLFLLVLQHIFRKGGSVDKKGEKRKPNFTAVTFSREAVKFFSKAVKFSREAVTFFGRNSHQPRQNSFYDLSHHACKYIIVITVNEPSPLAPLTPALGAGGVGGVGCFLLVPIIIRARGRMLRQKISIA